ncbi:arsenite S-adenosylmethyltransferase [Kouleothrix aurantiaca]|jgi:ubiquinone/menaquinone biosynthesis C-methylase UbiE|uniref:Arsenite methyltransferase n=1 Tax=Kouleothrix aurantiaca TaxID=186479 RepID=A0A0P9HIZ0_9CHLR|nr:arsenite S-adenosylmethyltransferase [Kouleothrix aurantiaca]
MTTPTTCCGPTATSTTTDKQDILTTVREHYGAVAIEVLANNTAGCCGSADDSSITQNLYLADQLEGLPLKAALASLGCGNPTALAELRPGEVVLDMGSGGGIDVLLSARRVGPTGFAYGLDMTDAMLELARHNAAEAGAQNVAFLKGEIAAIPLPDASVDVIVSNCVINLVPDKAAVFQEAFRVLKPGGRFAVSDIVIHGGLPSGLMDTAQMRQDLSSWAGCIAGALTDAEYRAGLAAAGFTAIDLEITRRYSVADIPASATGWTAGLDEASRAELVGRFASTFVRATKPAPGS